MSLTQKTIRAGLWALVQNGGRQLISTLVFLALARFFLTKDEFGLVALASLSITFLNVLVRQGLGTAIIQRREIQDIHLDSAFWANVVAAIALTLAVVAMADDIALLLGDIRVSPILKVLSMGMVITSLSLTHEAVLSRELRFKSLAIRTLVSSIASGAVGIGYALAGGGLWALVAMQLTASVAGLAVLWWASRWRPRPRFSASAFRELLPMSASMTGVAIVSTLNDLIDQFVIGRMLGAPSLGVYVVAQKVVKLLVMIFVQTFTGVALPSFSRLDGDIERTRNALLRASRMATFATFPIFLGLAATSDLVVPFLFGSGWDEAPIIMSLLCLWGVLASVNYFFSPALISIGQEKTVLLNTSIASVMLLIFAIVGAQFGITGVAISVLVRALCMFPLWIRQMHIHIGLSFSVLFASFATNLLAASIMVAVVVGVRSFLAVTPNIELLVSMGVGVVSYALFFLVFSRHVTSEFLPIFKLLFLDKR